MRQIVTILISNDSYHMKDDIMETLKFYREILNDNCIILKKNQKDITSVLSLGNGGGTHLGCCAPVDLLTKSAILVRASEFFQLCSPASRWCSAHWRFWAFKGAFKTL